MTKISPWFRPSSCVKPIREPSGDHARSGLWAELCVKATASPPCALTTKISLRFPLVEPKITCQPSGDQPGEYSRDGSSVMRTSPVPSGRMV